MINIDLLFRVYTGVLSVVNESMRRTSAKWLDIIKTRRWKGRHASPHSSISNRDRRAQSGDAMESLRLNPSSACRMTSSHFWSSSCQTERQPPWGLNCRHSRLHVRAAGWRQTKTTECCSYFPSKPFNLFCSACFQSQVRLWRGVFSEVTHPVLPVLQSARFSVCR